MTMYQTDRLLQVGRVNGNSKKRRVAMISRIAAIVLSTSLLAGCETARRISEADDANPGPCPNALSLYDAHRYVEINGDSVAFENIGFTGEITNVVSFCRYTDNRATPIDVDLGIEMAFGRGPAAEGSEKTYNYFISVTRTDREIISRDVFPVTVRFAPGEDRVSVIQEFEGIQIPRATPTTSGGNFEIIIGFELTPEQIEFNRTGQRFRVTAGQGD